MMYYSYYLNKNKSTSICFIDHLYFFYLKKVSLKENLIDKHLFYQIYIFCSHNLIIRTYLINVGDYIFSTKFIFSLNKLFISLQLLEIYLSCRFNLVRRKQRSIFTTNKNSIQCGRNTKHKLKISGILNINTRNVCCFI